MPLLCPVHCNCYDCTMANYDRGERRPSYSYGGKTPDQADYDRDRYYGVRSASDQQKVDDFMSGKRYW